MLILANVPLEDVRDGSYSYDNLTGMIMNFLYGDKLGVEYYKNDIIAKAEEAMTAVEASGAQTEAQKLLELNTWLAQHNTFDMSYIMNQMDPETPLMVAPDPVEHEHKQEIYDVLYNVYYSQIEAQFKPAIEAGVERSARLYLFARWLKVATRLNTQMRRRKILMLMSTNLCRRMRMLSRRILLHS